MVTTRSRGKPSDDAKESDTKEEIKLEDDDVLIIDEQAEADSDPQPEVQAERPRQSPQSSEDKKGVEADKDTSSDDSSVLDYAGEEADSDSVIEEVEKPVTSVKTEEAKKEPSVIHEPIVDVNMEEEQRETAELAATNEVTPSKISTKNVEASPKKVKVSPMKAADKLEKSSEKKPNSTKKVPLNKRKIEISKPDISGTKKAKKEEQIDIDYDDSDDDAPVEVSSKKVAAPDIVLKQSEVPEMSLFEQVQAKKQELADRKAGIKEKEKVRKIKRKQIRQGEFLVKSKKSQFKVITLNKGLSKKLEPERNFKAELLGSRTADRRVKDVKSALHRSKWGGRFD